MDTDGYRVRLAMRNVSFIIQLIDNFTGQAINSKDVVVKVEGIRRLPILKEGGYCVFTDFPKGKYNILVTSKIYCSKYIHILENDTIWNGINNILIVFLSTSCNYPISSNTTFITGKLAKESEFYIVPEKALYDIILTDEKNGIITFNTISDKNMVNRQVAFKMGETIDRYIIQGKSVDKKTDDEKLSTVKYQLKDWNENEKEHSYNDPLYIVSIGQADQNGVLFMPLWGLSPEECKAYLYLENGNKKHEIDIIYGKGIDINRQLNKEVPA